MAENRQKIDRPQNENLIPGGPGRPKGQRNYATIYREALIKLATMNNMEPEEMETDILLKGLASARKGDYRFWKDLHDRLHGTATQKLDHTTDGKPMFIMNADLASKNNITIDEPHSETD